MKRSSPASAMLLVYIAHLTGDPSVHPLLSLTHHDWVAETKGELSVLF